MTNPNDYQDNTIIRPDVIDGETNWVWNKVDNGAWEGPKLDWVTSHREKYLEYVKEPKVVITAGANQGLYARLYSKIFETVYAFEPDPMSFHCLVMNCQTPNVIKMNCALGFDPKFVTLNTISPDNTGQNTVGGPGIIPVLPLDAFNFERCDLLQLDVEGYEYQILCGARTLIEDCHPVIAAENGSTTEIQTLLSNLGYEKASQSVADSIYIHKDTHSLNKA